MYNGINQVEINWYCPQYQPHKLIIDGGGVRAFYVLEGETIYVLSKRMFALSTSYVFPELGRIAYYVETLVTDYTFPGRRYE